MTVTTRTLLLCAAVAGPLWWAMSGGRAGSLTLAVGAISAMLWISRVAWAAARRLSASRPASTGSRSRRS